MQVLRSFDSLISSNCTEELENAGVEVLKFSQVSAASQSTFRAEGRAGKPMSWLDGCAAPRAAPSYLCQRVLPLLQLSLLLSPVPLTASLSPLECVWMSVRYVFAW